MSRDYTGDQPTDANGNLLVQAGDALAFESFADAGVGNPLFQRDSIALDGRLQNATFDSYAELTGSGVVATVTFTVLEDEPASR